MGVVALVVGIVAAAVMIASQTGLLGGHDYLVVAASGLIAAVVAGAVVLRERGRQRTLALTGLGLALLPVGLLGVFLLISGG
jgi:hypothetical protein